ncbi:MAG: hypothetical protein ABIN35_05045, partial [candidate division WOR-3 bacterium]
MKKFFILYILITFIILLTALETGRLIDTPIENMKSLKVRDGVMVSENFVKKGFLLEKLDIKIFDPIFSISKFDQDLIVGTGGNSYIYNVTNKDTIVKFREGEIVRNIFVIDKKNFLASIEPSGIIVRIDNKKKCDTLFKDGNKSINRIISIDGRIYALVGENVFEFKKDKFEKFFQVNDRNCLQMKKYKNRLFFSTEGDGKLLSYEGGKTDYIFVSNDSEVKDFYFKDDKIFIFVNSKISKSEDPIFQEYKSYIVLIDKNIIDTLYSFDSHISQVIGFKKGILVFLSKPASIFYFDFKTVFFAGSFDFEFPTSVYSTDENVFVGNDGQPSLIRLKENDGKGEFFSRVFDFNSPKSITSIYPEISGKTKVFFRFGDSYEVDNTWTSFYPIVNGYNIELPKSKCFQYKVVLNDDQDNFKKIEIFYKGENRVPKIKNIEVFPPRILPDYAIPQNIKIDKSFKKKNYQDLKEQNIFKVFEKKIFIKWEGLDPDGDRLTYSLFLQDDRYEYPLVLQIEDNYFVFNYDNFSTGYYKIKVVATDSVDNTDFLKDQKVSNEFLIDNTPPQVKDDIFQNNRLKFSTYDEASFIDKVEVSINGSDFKEVLPVDQIYDNREERFVIDIPFDYKGTLSILVKIYDQFGNVTFLKKLIK